MELIIQHVLIKLLVLFHLEVLHALQLGLTTDRSDSVTNQLLYSDGNVLVNEVLHGLNFVQLHIQVLIDIVKLPLYLHALLLEVRLVLLGLL